MKWFNELKERWFPRLMTREEMEADPNYCEECEDIDCGVCHCCQCRED